MTLPKNVRFLLVKKFFLLVTNSIQIVQSKFSARQWSFCIFSLSLFMKEDATEEVVWTVAEESPEETKQRIENPDYNFPILKPSAGTYSSSLLNIVASLP